MILRHQPYDDDYFADTRMTFGEHIEVLRGHLVRAIYGFLVALVVGFIIAPWIMQFVNQPVETALANYRIDQEKALLEALDKETDASLQAMNLRAIPIKLRLPAGALIRGLRESAPREFGQLPDPRPDQEPVLIQAELADPARFLLQLQPITDRITARSALRTFSVTEAFVVYLQTAIVCGLVLASPVIFYEVWTFVAAGLYPHEKKLVHLYLPLSLGLFIGGVIVCQFYIMPAAIEALLTFNKWLAIEPDLRQREWLGFAIWMPVITGICFQTPLVMLFLGVLGVFSAHQFWNQWRIAAFLLLIFAAIISPSVDPFSLLILWLPMLALYFLGIGLVWNVERQRPQEQIEEVPYDPGTPLPSAAVLDDELR